MSAAQHFAIVYAPAAARTVAHYVARGFFSLREFPQAFARMVLTREFGAFVGVPLVLLAVARYIPDEPAGVVTAIAVAWLIAGLLRIARYGQSSGIGCYAVDAEGLPVRLVGGLRMRLERGSRRMWLAGLLVEPGCRGAGIGTALMLAAFRIARAEARHGPVTVAVFAPTHPASKAIIEKHLAGRQTVEVTEPPTEALVQVMERLEQALRSSSASFDWQLPAADGNLFQDAGTFRKERR